MPLAALKFAIDNDESRRRSTTNRYASVVECREQLKLIGLLFVMVDEERRLVHCDHLPNFFRQLLREPLSM